MQRGATCPGCCRDRFGVSSKLYECNKLTKHTHKLYNRVGNIAAAVSSNSRRVVDVTLVVSRSSFRAHECCMQHALAINYKHHQRACAQETAARAYRERLLIIFTPMMRHNCQTEHVRVVVTCSALERTIRIPQPTKSATNALRLICTAACRHPQMSAMCVVCTCVQIAH